MRYVKTVGTGFGFTDDKSDAMRLETMAQAEKWRDRLRTQFMNFSWKVLPEGPPFYLVIDAEELETDPDDAPTSPDGN